MTENCLAAAARRSIRHLEGARSRRVSPVQADVELGSMKLETSWDDDEEDDDLPHRREEEDDSEPDEDDPGVDDEEPLRVKKKSREGRLFL